LCLATIVLALIAGVARAGEVTPPSDASIIAAQLTFPDSSGSVVSTLPVQEDRVTDTATPQQALVPLPSGAWMGLVSLGCLALVSSRKAIIRFIT